MSQVFIVRDEFSPQTEWEKLETTDPLGRIMEVLGEWPEGAHLYHGAIAKASDVTPADEADLEALAKLPGPFFVVLHAQDISWWIAGAILIGALLSTAATLLLTPKVSANQAAAPSSNNALGERTNKARLGERIPDIRGRKLAVPDLIGLPLRLFDGNKEFELTPLCIGRGSFEIAAADIRDGGTPVSEIEGACVEIYGPTTSPNSGDAPQLTIGAAIGTEISTVYKIDGVNGQTLTPYLWKTVASAITGNVRFVYPNKITSDDADILNFTKFFEAGVTVVIAGAHQTKDGHTVNLDGTYVIDTINDDGDEVALLNVLSVTTDWNVLNLMGGSRTNPIAACTIDGSGLTTTVVGPFFVDVPDATAAVLNFVALNGLYKTDGKESKAFPVNIDIGVTPADSGGSPIGAEVVTTVVMPGSGVDQSQQALTAIVSVPGRCKIRVLRDTTTAYLYDGTVVDEIKWRDLFVLAPIGVEHFGNVTTIWAKQSVTQAALGIKDRKLTILGTHMVPERDGDGFSATLVASRDAADIICDIARDPYLGRQSVAELNVPQIRAAVAAVQAHFEDDGFGEFGFSFDNDQVSAQEMIDTVAKAVFCEAVRRGSVLELVFEGPTDDSAMILNHRNTKPGSQRREPSFGTFNRYDGVEATWSDGTDFDTSKTIRIPEDGSATNPQKVDLSGVRNFQPAHCLAMRYYNKARYQRWVVELDATQDAAWLTRLQRVLIANTARNFDGMSGEVVAQDGLILTLSQKPVFEAGTDYVIMLQYSDGSVGTIDITPGATANKIVLSEPPAVDLSTDARNTVKTLYWIWPEDASDAGRAFLITEKSNPEQATYHLTCINYDRRYYINDADGIPGLLDFGGSPHSGLIALLEDI